MTFRQCPRCCKSLPPLAGYCPRCGLPQHGRPASAAGPFARGGGGGGGGGRRDRAARGLGTSGSNDGGRITFVVVVLVITVLGIRAFTTHSFKPIEPRITHPVYPPLRPPPPTPDIPAIEYEDEDAKGSTVVRPADPANRFVRPRRFDRPPVVSPPGGRILVEPPAPPTGPARGSGKGVTRGDEDDDDAPSRRR